MPAEKAEAFASLIKAAFRLAGEEPAVWDSALGLTQISGSRSAEAPGVALKRLRQENHMTQRETARLLGCTQARISDMEAGVKPISAEAAQLLPNALGSLPRFSEMSRCFSKIDVKTRTSGGNERFGAVRCTK